MSITRAQLESELLDRVGPLLAYCGKDGATHDGTNADLTGPLREGLLSLGWAWAATVADADVQGYDPGELPQLLDVAELRARRNIEAALLDVDEQVGLNRQALGQIRADNATRIKELQELLDRKYGLGLGTLTAGVVDLGFGGAGFWGCD